MGEIDAAAGAFCSALHPRLVGVLSLQCGDRRLAEEIAQDTYARVCERWSQVRAMESPEAWTFRVAFNLLASRFRRAAAERRAHDRVVPARDDGPDDPTDAIAVRAAVSALPARQRSAVVLRYFADLSVVATAEIMGCAPGTVKSLTSQALDRLRAVVIFDDDLEVDRA
jgi:RNA polymerase sigma factor (sigma-70 family)